MKDYFDPKFYGTDNWWKHPYGFLYVDSVQSFCEGQQAYWILDVVGSYLNKMIEYDFLVITFDVEDLKCKFEVREDSGTTPIITQDILYTDMQFSIKLFWESGVLMFPSDH